MKKTGSVRFEMNETHVVVFEWRGVNRNGLPLEARHDFLVRSRREQGRQHDLRGHQRPVHVRALRVHHRVVIAHELVVVAAQPLALFVNLTLAALENLEIRRIKFCIFFLILPTMKIKKVIFVNFLVEVGFFFRGLAIISAITISLLYFVF